MIAFISVSDRTGVQEFALNLAELGYDIYSTGGTQRHLAEAGLTVHNIESLTGFPEILGGRIKSIHPILYGGVLARRDVPEHMDDLRRSEIPPIDLVCVNLYPFVQTVASGASLDECLEQIDIGGPAIIRAAAKNYPFVLVLVDPNDYAEALDALRMNGVSPEFRRRLAEKAFQHTAHYDTAIVQYLHGELVEPMRGDEPQFPERMTIALDKALELRYGENPHQRAALYQEERVGLPLGGIVAARQLHGKELSYNNILDADAAWAAVQDFREPTAVIVKHNSPCGIACHEDVAEAYRRALASDPVSAYGGIVAFNRPVTAEAVREMVKTFYEIVIAPEFEDEALALFRRKRDLRVLQASPAGAAGLEYRRVSGGLLVQEGDCYADDETELRVVTKRAPTAVELADLRFAWKAVKHVKSNAIVIARGGATVGIGAGQPNRPNSVHLALRQAGERGRGAVLASDGFFPFPDNVELAAQGGVTAVIQPGGSIRDEESIKASDAHGMAMVFTGVRHFRH